MISKGNKTAFTLAEIMIVVLILSIIFAVLAPVLTKKMTKSTTNVWNWVRPLTQLNASYLQYDSHKPAQAFFGITPSATSTADFEPFSKVIIRSDSIDNKIQKQIHFRFGYIPYMQTSSSERKNVAMQVGDSSGSWLMDTKNILIGGSYPYLLPIGNNHSEYSSSAYDYPHDNIALGRNALDNINNKYDGSTANKVNNNIAIGYKAGNSAQNSENNIYIGSNAGEFNTNGYGQIYIGYNAGSKKVGYNNDVCIGMNACSFIYNENLNETNNISVGYYSTPDTTTIANKKVLNNVSIGAYALDNLKPTSVDSENNIAIGYEALKNLSDGSNNIAIGSNACSESFNLGRTSNKICIGANSGPTKDSEADKALGIATKSIDTFERIYIGGKPENFGGDAVLEIHNIFSSLHKMIGKNEKTYTLNNFPDIVGSEATTVINGNLIVRGRTFFTIGDYLYNFIKNTGGFEGGEASDESIMCARNPLNYTFGGITDSEANCPRVYQPATSDRRLKNIGSKSTAGLAEVLKLNVFDYIFKNDKEKTPQIGVIAQDLMKIFPNSVMKNKDGFLSIKLDEMFFAAINAIKELDKKLISLTKKLYKVESTITKLEQENSDLKVDVANLTNRVNRIKASRGL